MIKNMMAHSLSQIKYAPETKLGKDGDKLMYEAAVKKFESTRKLVNASNLPSQHPQLMQTKIDT